MGQEALSRLLLDGHLDSDAPSVDFDPGFGWLHHGKAGWHTLKGTPAKKEHGVGGDRALGRVQIPMRYRRAAVTSCSPRIRRRPQRLGILQNPILQPRAS